MFRLFKKKISLRAACMGLAALTITGADKNKSLLEQIPDDQSIDQGYLLYELWLLRIFVVHEIVQGFETNAASREVLISAYAVAAKQLVQDKFALDAELFESETAERLRVYGEASLMTHSSGPLWPISGAFLKFLDVDENDLAVRMLICLEAGATAVAVKSFLGNIRVDYGQ